MNVYTYIYIYIHIHMHTYIYIYIHIHTYIHHGGGGGGWCLLGVRWGGFDALCQPVQTSDSGLHLTLDFRVASSRVAMGKKSAAPVRSIHELRVWNFRTFSRSAPARAARLGGPARTGRFGEMGPVPGAVEQQIKTNNK